MGREMTAEEFSTLVSRGYTSQEMIAILSSDESIEQALRFARQNPIARGKAYADQTTFKSIAPNEAFKAAPSTQGIAADLAWVSQRFSGQPTTTKTTEEESVFDWANRLISGKAQ